VDGGEVALGRRWRRIDRRRWRRRRWRRRRWRWRRRRRRWSGNHERHDLRELSERAQAVEEARLVDPADVDVIRARIELGLVDPGRLRFLET
jgi:hypothetical protein